MQPFSEEMEALVNENKKLRSELEKAQENLRKTLGKLFELEEINAVLKASMVSILGVDNVWVASVIKKALYEIETIANRRKAS